uniref:Small membrane A-kinase anchor protein n=1 Tax=Neogobius melanostomus TaxID=47308 RepID=A0A8C6T9S6_9GOBI
MGQCKGPHTHPPHVTPKLQRPPLSRQFLTFGPQDGLPPVNPVLLDYAQRLSEEIVARAVQQWAEVDRRYVDIPYIECDVP